DGPPGTGKSQTITNIIAECLAAGRTVLFVSEKAAALDVVKRRLTQVGLKDFLLELHSRQASKKIVLDEINRVLEKQIDSKHVSAQTAEELARVRDALNSYSRDLHEPFGAMGISPFEAMSRAVGLSAEAEAITEKPDAAAWTHSHFSEADEQLQRLDRRLARAGDPAKHPWRGVGLSSAGLREKQQILQSHKRLADSIAEAKQSACDIAALLGCAIPSKICDLSECVSIARTITGTPPSMSDAVTDGNWDA